ncbi:hypothetical protein DSM112329_02955 [Paraconexibacter sp. AEG42_29]|uniref:Uncharacterized protein n=1 Tax=Paraconexibacter sp. AEG42_29 TaxID=2997339 RepID=A0AAU7AWM2_9ACTN
MPRRRPTVPPPLPDLLCARLPFESPAPWLTRQLLRRAEAAAQQHTVLTSAEHAALHRLHDALTLICQAEDLLIEAGLEPVATRVLSYSPGDIILGLLWRIPAAGPEAYGVQRCRLINDTVTLLEADSGLRVDVAWPRYHELR